MNKRIKKCELEKKIEALEEIIMLVKNKIEKSEQYIRKMNDFIDQDRIVVKGWLEPTIPQQNYEISYMYEGIIKSTDIGVAKWRPTLAKDINFSIIKNTKDLAAINIEEDGCYLIDKCHNRVTKIDQIKDVVLK